MKPRVSMRVALRDPNLLGHVLQGSSWYGWRVLLVAAAGEKLTAKERVEFKRLTGREREPGKLVHDLVCIFGRRGGKTLALSVFDVWLACLCDHRDVLVHGEIGVALIISRDQRAATVTLNYIDGILRSSAVLSGMVVNRTADAIELTSNIRLEVRPCNRISGRSITCISVIAEEIGHWFTAVDFANPDVEVLASIRPTLMTTRGPVLMASSVYAKHGVLFDSYQKYYGPNGPPDILVAYGTSRDINPSLSQIEIDREIERDPSRNRAEYLSEWREGVEGFIPRDIVESCVGAYTELLPQPNTEYQIFIDHASGLPDGDSFAITCAHGVEDNGVVVDAIREIRPPFNFFEAVTTVLVPLCRSYSVHKVTGDAYGAELSRDPVRRAGLGFDLATKHKSDLYLDLLPLLNARKITLPRHERAINQICLLERSVQRSGKDQITHPTHGRDDVSNSIAGAAWLVMRAARRAELQKVPYAVPFVHSVPRNIPGGSAFAGDGGDSPVSPHSPHQPSWTEPWAKYVGVAGTRRDRWSPDW